MAFISYETSQNMLELLPVGPLRSEKVFLGDALGSSSSMFWEVS